MRAVAIRLRPCRSANVRNACGFVGVRASLPRLSRAADCIRLTSSSLVVPSAPAAAAAVSTQDGDDSARNSIGLTAARNNGQTLDTTGLVSTQQQVDVLLETIAFRIPVQLDSVQFVCCEQAVTVLAHCYIPTYSSLYTASHRAAKLAAVLLRVARITAGLAESNGSLPSAS